MDDGRFSEWLTGVPELTRGQRRAAFTALRLAEAASDDLPDDGEDWAGDEPTAADGAKTIALPDAARTHDGRAGQGASGTAALASASVVHTIADARVATCGCPHCGSRQVGRWGRANGLARYRCGACGRTFNGLTGTGLARLRKKECWQEQAAALIAGTSVAKAAERCGVAYTTAFRWRHRFLAAPATDKPVRLVGIVEADEMFVLESFKGKRSGLTRKARKRGGVASKRGLPSEQIPVLVARDRTGATLDAVLPKVDHASISAVLSGVVTPDNQLCCDGGGAIVSFARRAKIPHHILPAPGNPKPEAPQFHINNVNAYHGRFKEWARRFHGVATKYLDRYLGWRRTLEAVGPSIQPDLFVRAAVGLGPYQPLTI